MSASDAVTRLERAGDVERVPHPSDGRSSLIRLTRAGSRRAEAAAALLDRLARSLTRSAGTTPATHTRGARSTRGRLRAGTVMRRPDRPLVCHGSVILRIDASPPHRRCVPPALRGAGGGHRAAAARRGRRSGLPAGRPRSRIRRTRSPPLPAHCGSRAATAHASSGARRRASSSRRSERRASGRGRSRAQAARSGWSTATNPRSCASRPGRTGRRSASACRRRRSTSGAEAAVAWLAFDDSGSVARVMTSTNRVGARIFVGDGPSGFAAGASTWVLSHRDGALVRFDGTRPKTLRRQAATTGARRSG